jgi:hypothetical protein
MGISPQLVRVFLPETRVSLTLKETPPTKGSGRAGGRQTLVSEGLVSSSIYMPLCGAHPKTPRSDAKPHPILPVEDRDPSLRAACLHSQNPIPVMPKASARIPVGIAKDLPAPDSPGVESSFVRPAAGGALLKRGATPPRSSPVRLTK